MSQKLLTNEQVSSLCAALGHLLGSGIGTGDALLLLSQDEEDKALSALLASGAEQADGGSPLSRILEGTGVFPPYVSTLLASGEAVGKTDATLRSLGGYYARRARLHRQVKSALLYPAVLLGVLAVVMAILLIWVLPIFNDVYAGLGSSLTGFAGLLLHLGQLLKSILPVLACLAAAILILAAIAPLRAGAIRFFRKHMGDKGVLGQVNSARFLQALSLGVSCGMTDPEAAALASRLSEDPDFSRRCQSCTDALAEGTPLPRALLENRFLQPSQVRLLEAGIRSGHRDTVLEDISRDALQRSEESLALTAGKIEPAMVILACLLIGSVLLSVMLPLMNILSALG